MNPLIIEIIGVWLITILIGLPLFASMGLAALAFVLLGGMSPSIVPQKMAQAMNSFPLGAVVHSDGQPARCRQAHRSHRTFCDVARRLAARRLRAREHPVEHDLRRHGGFCGRGCRGHGRGRSARDEEGRLPS